MVKKQSGKSGKVPNRVIYSRLSFLYQAATYLGTLATPTIAAHSQPREGEGDSAAPAGAQPQHPPQGDIHAVTARRLLADLRGVSLKTQIRIDPSIKRTVCKYCDSLLVDGTSCTSFVENKSRGGRKPWADVLVLKCGTCGGEKRFPVAAPRQKRRPFREEEGEGRMEGVEGGEGSQKTLPQR